MSVLITQLADKFGTREKFEIKPPDCQLRSESRRKPRNRSVFTSWQAKLCGIFSIVSMDLARARRIQQSVDRSLRGAH